MKDKKASTRRGILEAAMSCICGDREEEYGSPEDSFEAIAGLWNAYISAKFGSSIGLKGDDVGLMMALLKIGRTAKGRFKTDSFVDGCGYMACAGEIAAKEGKE